MHHKKTAHVYILFRRSLAQHVCAACLSYAFHRAESTAEVPRQHVYEDTGTAQIDRDLEVRPAPLITVDALYVLRVRFHI